MDEKSTFVIFKLEPLADLFCLSALHMRIISAYISWFIEEGGKKFCEFVFVCFTFNTKAMNKLFFNNIFKSNSTNNSSTVQIFLPNHPLATQKKSWST